MLAWLRRLLGDWRDPKDTRRAFRSDGTKWVEIQRESWGGFHWSSTEKVVIITDVIDGVLRVDRWSMEEAGEMDVPCYSNMTYMFPETPGLAKPTKKFKITRESCVSVLPDPASCKLIEEASKS